MCDMYTQNFVAGECLKMECIVDFLCQFLQAQAKKTILFASVNRSY